MGSWNETCCITRMPIRAGEKVVALTTVSGPDYQTSDSGHGNALLFGVPLYGTYDDYGGIENVANASAAELMERTFGTTGLYRKVVVRKAYGATSSRWVACAPDVFFGLEHKLKHLFLGEEFTPARLDSYDEKDRESSLAAFKACERALKTLGNSLAEAVFPEEEALFMDHLFGLVQEAFGRQQAWAAWSALTRGGLFAHQNHILVHQAAWDAVIKEFGSRKVGFYNERSRIPLRQFLSEALMEFIGSFEEKKAEVLRMFGDQEAASPKMLRRTLSFLEKRGTLQYLAPLSRPWLVPELPLIGHFWCGAELPEILEAVGRDAFVDYAIFQWARHYMRISIEIPGGGSQSEETVLFCKAFEAVRKTLVKEGLMRRDFSGILHR